MEFDPDVLVLRRADGSVAARFSSYGIDLDKIRQAAEEDFKSSEEE